MYLIIQDGIIINYIEWDGKTNWKPPENTTVVEHNGAPVNIGWQWDGTKPIPPANTSTIKQKSQPQPVSTGTQTLSSTTKVV